MSARIELQCRDGEHVAPKQVVDFDKIKGLVTQSQTLQHNLAALAAAPDSANRDSVRSTIDMAAEAARSLDSIVLQLWNTIPVTLRPTDASSPKAHMPDLLSAQQTSRVFRDTVNGSAKLKTLMGLQSVVNGHFFSCLEQTSARTSQLPGWIIDVRRNNKSWLSRPGRPQYETPLNTVKVTLYITTADLRIGTCCREMLVCQPSPKSATLVYTELGKDMPDPAILSVCEKGLTVGELYDTVVAMWESQWVQEEKGDVKGLLGNPFARQACMVNLEVELKDSDPIVKQRRARHDAEKRQHNAQ
ncbi:hypothetical protein Slin15195_G043390 [Septoria linicola]|uniref:Uncharacterized protein n=1 Tax=Septoria linicola TaxID=215465 RepID=A0A9Q9AL46_9PEZI|nr:hypothetical protein Slin15195_G043390 [Septoria linicola]